ncbi:XapX domain-containing protein [Rubrivivax gelatinosus]|uniref:DUF1427 family protein n=1 Tax=Rubrivivax gelatinosus TaxID=28068 RepID=UPI001908C247|nr:DUF1427 family protein [Rubrivivax gelatinosus]MBK1614484.1 XapX domain-containing protein [Rubrivivax gelatinosus]
MTDLLLALALGLGIGLGCRWFDLPLPAPPRLVGALLVVAMTLGFVGMDTLLRGSGMSPQDLSGAHSRLAGPAARPKGAR